MILVVQCPACGRLQRFESRSGRVTRRTRKQCVYCGTRFAVVPAVREREA